MSVFYSHFQTLWCAMGSVPENASLEPCDAKVAGEGFDLSCVMCIRTNRV